MKRPILAACVLPWSIVIAALWSAQAEADPSCGMGIPPISTGIGGYCDTPPLNPQGQHFHCSWSPGIELCEYRWSDGTVAPFPRHIGGRLGA